jgi:hypothetical protein
MKTEKTKIDYRAGIRGLNISRKQIAEKIGMSYSSLTMRIGGFAEWQLGEEEKLQKIIREAKKEKSCPK